MTIAYFALFDVDGAPTGFYPSDVHAVAPAGSVQITETQWREFIAHPAHRRYVNGEVVVYDPPPGPPPPPPALTRRQLRLGLLANGITTAQVEAVIASIPDEIDRETAQIEWADASTYERSHPLVDQIGAAMGLTPEQIDMMWFEAALL